MSDKDTQYPDETTKASSKRLFREVKNLPEYKVFRKRERSLFLVYAIIHILLSFALYSLISRQFQTDAGTVFEFFFLSAILLFFFGLISVFTTPEITTGTINSIEYNERKSRMEYKIVHVAGDVVRTYITYGITEECLCIGDPVYVLDRTYIIRKEY